MTFANCKSVDGIQCSREMPWYATPFYMHFTSMHARSAMHTCCRRCMQDGVSSMHDQDSLSIAKPMMCAAVSPNVQGLRASCRNWILHVEVLTGAVDQHRDQVYTKDNLVQYACYRSATGQDTINMYT